VSSENYGAIATRLGRIPQSGLVQSAFCGEPQNAEFERDLLRERVRSGIAAARKRGVIFGRRPGQRVKADRLAPKVLKLVGEGQSYREISHRLGLSKNTVLDIVKRHHAARIADRRLQIYWLKPLRLNNHCSAATLKSGVRFG